MRHRLRWLALLWLLGSGCDSMEPTGNDAPPSYAIERAELVSSISSTHGYGSGVALSDDQAFVSASGCRGAYYETAGAIAVFSFQEGQWIEEQVIERPDERPAFACFISATSEFLITSAGLGEDDKGGVHVFSRVEEEWRLFQTLVPSDGVYEGGFGASLSISGNTIAVGNRFDSVRIYEFNGTSFELETTITPPDESIRWFGYEVDLEGDRLLIGTGDRGDYEDRAMYAYVRSGDTWNMVLDVVRPTGEEIIMFAHSVAIDGDMFFAGTFHPEPGEFTGGVELFYENGSVDTIGVAMDSLGIYHGLGGVLDADKNRLVVTEPFLGRLVIFEKYQESYTEIGVVENTLLDTIRSHADIEMHGDVILVSNNYDPRVTIIRLKRLN